MHQNFQRRLKPFQEAYDARVLASRAKKGKMGAENLTIAEQEAKENINKIGAGRSKIVAVDKEGNKVDFNKIYKNLIKPTIEEVNLSCLRCDEISKAGMIHKDMFITFTIQI